MIVIFDCQRGAGERLHNNNDISMFEQVGLAVAMGNGAAVLQETAHLVAPPAADDLAAQVIERLWL